LDAVYQFLSWLEPHWKTIALAVTWGGIAVVYFRRWSQWRRKHFLTHVNFSLNYVVGSAPVMRTLLEKPANEVWLNEHGVRRVLAAARRTTAAQPFILLKADKDQEFANRAVLNALSERFASAFVAAAMGAPVRKATFCFALTCEKYSDIRTIKLRVLLVEKRTLVGLFGPEDRAAGLEVRDAIYHARLKTLRALYDLYVKDQARATPLLGQIELGVPAVTAGQEAACANPTTAAASG
jgi:hypothetical protein